jgi:biopolymer transport protein ExbB/TolQ
MEFNLIGMWQEMGPLAKGVAILLIGMSIVSLYFFIERELFFRKAKTRSKEIAPKLADMLKLGQVKEALALALKKENHASHLARITAAGVTEFLSGKESGIGFEEQIETASRGCDRAESIYNQELKRGLSIIATIATSAPFIGLFGTITGIMNAFSGMAKTGSGGIGAVATGIAEALITTAVGIGVAVIALWIYNILNARIEVMDAEMSNTASQVVDFFVKKQAK